MTKPLNGYAVQMVNRNPKIRSQFVWAKGETPACERHEKAHERYVSYCVELSQILTNVGGAALLEGWQAQAIAEIRVVYVVDDIVQGEPLHSRTFATKQEKRAA